MGYGYSAVQVTFGVQLPLCSGVNALSGISTSSLQPPKSGDEQDYIVVGKQPWLDGIVSGPGVVHQVHAAIFK